MEKRKKVEIIVIVLVIALAVGILWAKRSMSTTDAKEKALIDELRNMRMAIGLYQEVNKVYPTNLRILITNKFSLSGEEKPYLSGVEADKEGYPIDSFGNRFTYDPNTGEVKPSEGKYSTW